MSLPWNKLIVALDLEEKKDIEKVVRALKPKGVKFKIGSIAFTKFGPDLVNKLIKQGADVFLDLKLHDIPNTMRQTARVITQMGCWAFTVHTSAGQKALREVKQQVAATARAEKKRKPLILGVTELTSSSADPEEVLKLAAVAEAVGLDAVVASAQEAAGIKQRFPKLKVVTPGIRNPGDEVGDQKRITTARTAFENGADYIVVGRPIISKKDYLAAAEAVLKV